MEKVVSPTVDICDPSVISEQALFHEITNRVRESLELTEILSATVTGLRAYLGTDRVKIYQFFPDGHGWVIAEALNNQNLPSLKGLHFPADDIPPYLRELFVRARQRSIVDVAQKSVHVSKLDCADTATPLPSHEEFSRPIDPCHLEYLRALGVQSSVAVPIVLEKPDSGSHEPPSPRDTNQLWGLVVSHNAQPRTISPQELDFFQSVVDQLSIAISQSMLLEKVREQARREADVNRVTALLYTTATVQLERALVETVTIYQGSGGRLILFGADEQSQPQLYTCGDQPTPLPGDGERPVEENSLWRNFLKSTLMEEKDNDDLIPWSIPWMKTKYAHPPLSRHLDDINIWAIADIYQEPLFRSLTACFQLTDIRGVMICPLHYGGNLVGCLTIFRRAVDQDVTWAGYHIPDERQMTPRQSFEAWQQLTKGCGKSWSMAEIRLMHSLAERFSVAVKQYQLNAKVQALNTNLERQVDIRTRELNHSTNIANQQRTLADILAKLQKPLEMQTLFRTATQEVLQLLKVDRVAVYRFDEDWGGEFVDEFGAVSPGWAKIVLASRSRWNDSFLQTTQGGRYRNNEIAVVHDIYDSDLSHCHQEVLAHYYIRAFIIVPLFVGQKLWGLLATYQHEEPRQWEDSEAAFVSQLATHLGVALQQAESIERVQTQANALAVIADQQTALNNVITKIRNSLDLDTIFKTTTIEMCQLLNADRVAVFRFAPESDGKAGEVISEEIRPGFPAASSVPVKDKCFVTTCKDRTDRRDVFFIDDVANADITPCYREMLDSFQIRANLVVPLFNGEELWGLLCIHQCSGPRTWTPRDKEFAVQIAAQLEVALQQAKLLIEAQESRKNADNANHAKSQFLANMSHELRTPLNAILGLGQLLSQDPELTEKQQQHLKIIGQSGEHLLSLINEVLDMSRIESGLAKLEPKTIYLPEFFKSLEAMLEVAAVSKGLDLTFAIAPDVPEYILADEGKLRQVLINLLSNGLKFTQVGEVMLRVFIKEKPDLRQMLDELHFELHFEIKDTGPGIPSEELSCIFDPFCQGDSSSQSHEGNGLGLSICRQFISLMGGDISVSSEVGVGSTFHFFIQAILATPPLESSPSQSQRITKLASNQTIPKILVVEDIEINQMMLVDFLETMGFVVKTANNGQEAIDCWKDWAPDLIWMDMCMPIMDGYQATREIKHRAGKLAPVIIALTANVFEADRQIALDHGCDDFVRKPFQIKELLAMMAKYLGVQYNDAHEDRKPAESKQLSILVAEDDPPNQTTINDMLSHLGHNVTIANNGLEAIELLKQKTFDVVLMDIHMPEMDGFEATQQIRKMLPHPQQPVIVGATGSAVPEDLAHCLELGMDTTLVKPFSLEALRLLFASLPTLTEARAQTNGHNPDKQSVEKLIDTMAEEVDDSIAPAVNEASCEELEISEAGIDEPTILDRQYFEDYHSIFGEQAPRKIIDKIRKCLDEIPQRITKIRDAIAIADHPVIFQEAHAFKSIVGYVGGTEMVRVCEALEINARQHSPDHYAELDQQVELESQRLRLALEFEIDSYRDQSLKSAVAATVEQSP